MAVVVVVLIVATPFTFAGWLIDRVLKHRAAMRQLQVQRQYMALPAASPQVEQRLRNLEAIVTSAEYDFAARMNSRDSRAA